MQIFFGFGRIFFEHRQANLPGTWQQCVWQVMTILPPHMRFISIGVGTDTFVMFADTKLKSVKFNNAQFRFITLKIILKQSCATIHFRDFGG
jgi:hypothetical protein